MAGKRSHCSEDRNASSAMLATLPLPAHGDFGRAGIHGHITSVTNDNLDQQSLRHGSYTGTSGTQCYYSTDRIRLRGKSNGSHKFFGKEQVLSPTLSVQ